MRVLHVCSELFPLLKTGGLADVAGALPPALAKLGCDGRVLVPGFPAFMQGIEDKHLVVELPSKFGATSIRLLQGTIPNTEVEAYIIDAPGLFDRLGNPYAASNGQAYPDNYRRFALLGWVAANLAEGLDPTWKPEVVHGHDWHSGLAAAYIKAAEIHTGRKLAATILTVHNLAYQGLFPAHVFGELELPSYFFGVNGLEFFDQVSFLKAGLFFSDKLTTVSPSYADEIQDVEQGCGLSGLLGAKSQDLVGILNGVDPAVWSPEIDPILASKFSARSMVGKAKCKTALQEYTGLKVQNEYPLFTTVSRLTEQKGLHLVVEGALEIIKRGGQIAVLGSGEPEIESAFAILAEKYPESVAVQLGYDEDHAHRLVAGSDVIMVPSRFEPCGLTQLYGMIYGTLPLVHKVGGLADTVTDCSLENLADETATGFVFNDFDVEGFNSAARRAFALFARKTEWKKVQKFAMAQDLSWDAAAQKYFDLYQQVTL